jgi:putative transposase
LLESRARQCTRSSAEKSTARGEGSATHILYAEIRSECERLRDEFAARYRKLYPKAVETVCRDWERMVTFHRFPNWIHLRTTNVVQSPFSAVRPRTDAARRYKKVASAEALIWKALMIAEKKFRRLISPELLEQV